MRFVDVSSVRSTFDEPVTTRDGVRLSADVYRPTDPGRYPVLLTRTPYDNNRLTFFPQTPTAVHSPADGFKILAAHGFVVVACDVRGRGDSDGSFAPFVHEARDGADAIAWARELPEVDGRIGVFGTGYAGFAALAAATQAPVDAVAAWSPFGAHATPFDGGALRLEWLFWMHLVAGRTPQPVDIPDWHAVFRHRPLISMDEALGRDDIPWGEWLDGTADLQPLALDEELRSIDAPVLLVSGWWDAALTTTMRYWERARSSSAAEKHALLVGPWDGHGVRHPQSACGGVAWGPSAVVDPNELLVEWFAGHLQGTGEPPGGASLFVTGRNEWTDVAADGAAVPSTMWLTSGGRANTRVGDGRLAVAPVEHDPPDSYTHDPDHPVPWQPDGGSFSRSAPGGFRLDTAFATSRDDVLVYQGEPVSAAALVCGSPQATLWVKTDAEQADWIVTIEDVFPGGGRSVHLAHGAVRAARQSPSPIELTIPLTPVAHELLPGHALRLTVTSSLWPLYAVNLGGDEYLRGVEPRISLHTVLHDREHPSRVDVPFARGVHPRAS